MEKIKLKFQKDTEDYMNIVIIEWKDSPLRATFIEKLLKYWNWDFKWGLNNYHEVMTGNCGHNENDMISHGDYHEGDYMNAPWYCSHCYWSSNPAMMKWTSSVIVLQASEESSKLVSLFHVMKETSESLYSQCFDSLILEIQNGILKNSYSEFLIGISDYSNNSDSLELLIRNYKSYIRFHPIEFLEKISNEKIDILRKEFKKVEVKFIAGKISFHESLLPEILSCVSGSSNIAFIQDTLSKKFFIVNYEDCEEARFFLQLICFRYIKSINNLDDVEFCYNRDLDYNIALHTYVEKINIKILTWKFEKYHVSNEYVF